MREMSVSEQRYQAILAVIADGRAVSEVAQQWKVDRRTVHSWLARSKGEGLVGLTDRSHRPERWWGGGCGGWAARGGPGQAAEDREAPSRSVGVVDCGCVCEQDSGCGHDADCAEAEPEQGGAADEHPRAGD